MVDYFYGPDTYGAREAIGDISKAKQLPIRWIDKEDLAEHALGAILDQANSGLFGGQLAVVRDASSFPKAQQEHVVSAAKTESTVDWIVWDRDDPDKRSALFKALKPIGTAFSAPSPDDAAAWLQKVFPNIERAAAGELARRCASDRWRMKNEVEKLTLTHQPITRQIVEQEVSPQEATDEIFPFLDALASGSSRRAMQSLDELLIAGNSELYILSMLGYQYKTLLAIAAGKADGLHPYVIQKNKPAAKRYSVSSLQTILARLAATDFAIKQGKADQRTALIMVVLNLLRPTAA